MSFTDSSLVVLDHRMLHKFVQFFVETADELICSIQSITAPGDYFPANPGSVQAQFRSLASEYDRFTKLLSESPHISADVKASFSHITLGSWGNERVRFLDRLAVLFPKWQTGTIGRSQYAVRSNQIHIDILKEFRDRLTEIGINVTSRYL